MPTFMFEVYYHSPEQPALEAELLCIVEKYGGWLDFEEKAREYTICLTYEFSQEEHAELAAAEIRKHGNYVEGPVQYT